MNMKNILKESLDEKIKKQHRYLGAKSVHVIYGKKDNKLAVHIFTKDGIVVSEEKIKFVKDEEEYNVIKKAMFDAFLKQKKIKKE